MNAALALFDQAFRVTLLLALPIIGVVGAVGVVMGLLQTIVQIQDQNVAFGPKVAALAVLLSVGGMAGLRLLELLLQSVVQLLPLLARGSTL